MELKVLHEDNHLIAVYKPAGVLVQGDASEDETLLHHVREYIRRKHNKPGNIFLGLLHRLDRPVSGIVLFAKTSKGAARLSEQIRNHEVTKIYTALVNGKPEHESGKLMHYLFKNNDAKKSEAHSEPAPGRDYAELFYKVIKSNGSYSLLEIKLETGRFHQIRVQLAEIGYPIVGDVKYGSLEDFPLALCATKIVFRSATGDEMKTIEINYPAEWDRKLM